MFQVIEQYEENSHRLSLSVLLVILVASLFKFFTRHSTRKLKLPPSPSRLPIIGNLHQLGSLPHRSLGSLARKHGPLMMVRFGQKPTVIVSSAEAVREMMKTQDLIFSNRPHVSAAERQLYSNKDLTFSPYGEYWRQVRRMFVVKLLSASRVESFRSVREEEVNNMISKIHQSCASGSSVVNLSERLVSYTNDVVCRVSLGKKYNVEVGGSQFLKMVTEFLYLLGVFNVGDYIPWLSWLNNFNGINARIEENFQSLDSFFERVIEEHIEQRKNGKNGGGEVEDFVDVLLGVEESNSLGVPFGRDNIKALILDMFVAGTDSAASSTVWAMTELIRHPKIMKEVQREVREISKGKPYVSEEDLAKMDYLKMVVKETFRLHTAAPLLLPRESTADTKLQGYDIPAKTTVIINAWAIGRDPKSWEEPEEFRPIRFKNRSLDLKEQDFELIPFGGGRRGCPGGVFAVANIELSLANLLYHFEWNLPDGVITMDVTETAGNVAQRKYPLLLAATPHSF